MNVGGRNALSAQRLKNCMNAKIATTNDLREKTVKNMNRGIVIIMTIEQVLLSIDFSLERIADNLETLVREGILTPTATPTDPECTAEAKIDAKTHRGRPKGTIPHCPRCRRPHRHSRKERNGRCIDCEHEEWWSE